MAAWDLLWATTTQFVGSNLFGTLITAAFGAFAGAFAASRVQNKRVLVAELNTINAALALCFSICKTFLSLKGQLLRPMYDRYMQAQRDYDDFLRAAQTHKGPLPLVFEFHADLETIAPVKVPTEVLERHVFEKISIQGRGLVVAVDLVGAIDSLEKSFQYRNDLIAEFHEAKFSPNDKALVEKYLSRQTASGVIDNKFRSNIEAIHRQVDNCIFFSRILADDLLEYGGKVRKRNRWKYFRLSTPKLMKAD